MGENQADTLDDTASGSGNLVPSAPLTSSGQSQAAPVSQPLKVSANAPDIFAPSLAFTTPPVRPLQVYAFDPSLGRIYGNTLTLTIRHEPLLPGPVGERLAVIDYDGATKRYYAPINLEDPALLLRGGLDPMESDPRFHQQMVYAVASETLERFEAALGRRVHWWRDPNLPRASTPPAAADTDQAGADRPNAPAPLHPPAHIDNRLNLYPHAMAQANAFYSREAHGVLFGYFSAGPAATGQLLPGQTVFTCLSHDIIVHEVTHAVVDGIRSHFTEATNIDVPAFHEAFADLAALFRHFSHSDALVETLQRTGGRLYTQNVRGAGGDNTKRAAVQGESASDNPLVELARQFGETGGSRNGLRAALGGVPDSHDIRQVTEPHARGAILVAAVFDAYFTIYLSKTADFFRVFRAGGGRSDPVDLPAPLAGLLADQASKTAEMFFAVCVRALDYCPPVDITFGDYLRALITADLDLYPLDTDGVRDALMQSFRVRGIVPDDAAFFSESSLCWPKVDPDALPAVDGLVFGDPNGLTQSEKDTNGQILRDYATNNAEALQFAPKGGPIQVPSFHPMFRQAQDGSLKIDMVVEMTQETEALLDPQETLLGNMTMRSGVTLIIGKPRLHGGERAGPRVRYAIIKPVRPDRVERQRTVVGLYGSNQQINFGLLHGLR